MMKSRLQLPLKDNILLLLNANKIGYIINSFMVLLILFIGYNYDNLDVQSVFYLHNNSPVGEGEIVNIFPTNQTMNDETYYGFDYVFHHELGNFEYTSYGLGELYDIGEKVYIQYNPDKPHINRISGLSNQPILSSFYYIFIFIFISWIVNTLFAFNKLSIIRNAILVDGERLSVTKTLVRINNDTLFNLKIKYKTIEGTKYTLSHYTTYPYLVNDYSVLYHKKKPGSKILLASLPSSIQAVILKKYNEEEMI